MDDRNHPQLNDYAARLIHFKARMLSRRRGFALDEPEDIEQDLWLDLLERLPRYDPAKATLNTFIARVVERRMVSLIRHRSAEKRSPDREGCSLNDPVRDSDGRLVERHQTTPEASSTWQRLHDLERDVADLREWLPSEIHRLIVDALGRGGTENSIAQELGISRRAVKGHMAELRRIFEDADLRDYL